MISPFPDTRWWEFTRGYPWVETNARPVVRSGLQVGVYAGFGYTQSTARSIAYSYTIMGQQCYDYGHSIGQYVVAIRQGSVRYGFMDPGWVGGQSVANLAKEWGWPGSYSALHDFPAKDY